jgi:hypothetical protein
LLLNPENDAAAVTAMFDRLRNIEEESNRDWISV